MLTTQANIALHREGLLKLINDGVDGIPSTWSQIVPNKITSKQAYEEIMTHSGLGFFNAYDEGDGVTYDMVVPRFTKRYTPIIRVLGIKYTRQAKQKDLYGFVSAHGPMLADAATATMNLLAANLLNTGFPGSNPTTSPDGVSLFNDAHPLVTGSDSNRMTQSLSGLALENAIQLAMSHKGDRGIPRYYRGGFRLVVPPGLAGLATRALKSSGLQGTSDNDTNAFVQGYIKGDPIVEQFLAFNQPLLANSWYLLPAAAKDNPLFYMEVAPKDVKSAEDIDNFSVKFVSSFEGVFDTFGYRGLVGSQV